MAKAKKTRSVPFFASDTARGYLIVGIALVPSVVFSTVIPRLDTGMSAATIAAVSAFFTWALLGFATGIVTILVFRRASGAQLKAWLRATEPRHHQVRLLAWLNGGGASSWAISGSMIAVAAVLVLSVVDEFRSQPLVVFSGLAVVVGSLFMTIASYAVRYAREQARTGAFNFPETELPAFSDFLYLSVKVSTSLTTSDVAIETTAARKQVTVHSLVSFAFNTVIVALLVAVLNNTAL